jgi:hypothetical protein
MAIPCKDKSALLVIYSDTSRAYGAAVAELHDSIGVVGQAHYDRLHRIAEDARLATDAARIAMEEHTKKHGC